MELGSIMYSFGDVPGAVFTTFSVQTGLLAELDRKFPSYLSAWNGECFVSNDELATHYGFVSRGRAALKYRELDVTLHEGMFFCVPGDFSIHPESGGQGIIVSREAYRGQFGIGGPVEHKGRLRYIDGCTDSLLVPPLLKGDPCLNLLHFPGGVDQTAHVHPSDRIGIIISGLGKCHYWNAGTESVVNLEAGMIFCIHAQGLHKFSTPYGQDMRVLAYHPDSDFGPTHEDHPMLNRTLVRGVSAKFIDEIRTITA
ncbi:MULTISPECIES: hypothetical protein [unclassified Bradyrhizobium]|uniref:hypothetical protein n=1 Tax=unclassified Bradyrhizobium TaxID=2631580 RepID=UPI0029167007|nr:MULTISPECIES: hypothetical protein [unclassified Bradyrhizobium]